MLRKIYIKQEEAGKEGAAGAAAGEKAGEKPPASWRDTLPDDLKAEPSLAPILDVPTLAKGYVAAQKLVGADRVIVPTQHATEQDWQGVFKKLGNPEKLEDYKIERPKDAAFDDEFVGAFKAIAHKAGVLPKQAQNLVNWFNEASKARAGKLAGQYKQEIETGMNALKTEWGDAYAAKLSRANQILMAAGGDDLSKLLVETGLNNHPTIIKAFAGLGDFMKEDAIPKDEVSVGAITPGEADDKIREVFNNPEHPYHHPMHAGNKAAIKEMEGFFAAKFANQPRPQTSGQFPRMSS